MNTKIHVDSHCLPNIALFSKPAHVEIEEGLGCIALGSSTVLSGEDQSEAGVPLMVL